MNRLMRAEWYRVCHSSGFLKLICLVSAAVVVLPVLANLTLCEKTVAENLTGFQETWSVFLPLFAGVFVSAIVGVNYLYKTAYYEVMAGHRISHILFSKLFVLAPLMIATIFAAAGIYLFTIFCVNGMGEVEKPFLRLIMLVVILFHICTVSIWMTTSMKHIISVVGVYLRFLVVDGLFMVGLQYFQEMFGGEEKVSGILSWFMIPQIMKVMSGEVDAGLIFAIIASFLLEGAIWYVISYVGMKKKNYR